jgi:folate-binding protein YgfZ
MNRDFLIEYKAVRGSNGAGLLEFPLCGLIEVSGTEAAQFLNGLITNDVKKMENYSWMLAAFANAQGRLLALARVLRIEDKFLFDVDAANYAKILQNLTRFTFAGDFRINDLTNNLRLVAINGERAFEIVNRQLEVPNAPDKIAASEFQNKTVFVIRDSQTAAKGFDLFAPKAIYDAVKNYLLDGGAIEISEDVREVLRVEAGTPKYGTDVDETTVVLETGQDRAVSFTKGCYIGQEIIARIYFRGHVAKRLSGLVLSAEAAPGDELKSSEGKNAGRITSVVFSPALQKFVALALVRWEFLAEGTKLNVGENITGQIVELPFVKSKISKQDE